MSFKIECSLCGTTQKFHDKDKAREYFTIDIEITESAGYQKYPEEITFYCGNQKCNNYINLKY